MQIGCGRTPSLSEARDFFVGERVYGWGMLPCPHYLYLLMGGGGSLEVPSSIIKSTPLRSAPCCVIVFVSRSQHPHVRYPPVPHAVPPRPWRGAAPRPAPTEAPAPSWGARTSSAPRATCGWAPRHGGTGGGTRPQGCPRAGPGPRGGLRPPWGSRSVVGERGASSVLGLPPRLKWVKKEKKRARSQLGTWLTCLEEVGTCGELRQVGVN